MQIMVVRFCEIRIVTSYSDRFFQHRSAAQLVYLNILFGIKHSLTWYEPLRNENWSWH